MHKQSNTHMPTTLVVGCGDVGSRLAQTLVSLGHRVYGLRRNISYLPKGVIPIIADLSTGELGEWPDHIDYVVYSAAANSRTEAGYRAIYVDALERVLARIKEYSRHPRRLFFTSSTAVYHQQNGEWVDEHSETRPQNFTGKIMLEAERLLVDSDLPVTVVRFGGIYGPGRNYMVDRVKNGEIYDSRPLVYGNRIHADDCAGLLSYLIKRDFHHQGVCPLYLGVDSAPSPLCETSRWLAKQLGVQPRSTVSGRQRGSKRCSNKRILDAGYQFQYPSYKEGYGELLD